MAQPAGWLWGLVPLTLLWGAGTVVMDDAVRHDVASRAERIVTETAGQVPGARAVMAQVVGRDVQLSGEAVSVDGATKAMARVRAEFGVRRALGGLSQVVAQKPYSWSASLEGNTAVLSGFVPDEATALANVAAAAAALSGSRIDDRQQLAFGAPAGFDGMTRMLLAEMAGLASGKVPLDDGKFCIEGKAKTPDQFQALKTGRAAQAQGDFKPVECNLEPPTMTPYLWSAERAGDAVAVTGFYPSDEIRQQVAALLRRGFPDAVRFEDRSKPALGAPSAFLAKVTRAIADLGRLRDGKAALENGAYTLTGAGPLEFDACQALRLQIAQTDGPDSVAQATIECPPAPLSMPALPEIPPLFIPVEPPAPTASIGAEAESVVLPPGLNAKLASVSSSAMPVPMVALSWQARKGERGVTITGLVPSETERAALLQTARAASTAGQVEDRLAVEPNLRDASDYRAATGFLLDLLGKMSSGTVGIEGRAASLAGAVTDEENWRLLDAALKQRPLPGGLSGSPSLAALGLRPYGLTISADKSGVSLSGYWPDAEVRASVLALLEGSALQGKLSDSARIVPGAPAGFGAGAKAAMVDLLRLDLGTARLSEAGLEIQGLTCRELIKSEVETSIASGLPAGISGRADIALRQTGCVVDPPNTCQNDLDSLTQRYSVLFGQGTAIVVLDPTTERAITDALAILKQCPAARVTVEGHANRDGERFGFDNLDLSNRRAQRVRDELVKRGITAAQLEVKGYGAQRPLVAHDDLDAKVKNRRVQFTVVK